MTPQAAQSPAKSIQASQPQVMSVELMQASKASWMGAQVRGVLHGSDVELYWRAWRERLIKGRGE